MNTIAKILFSLISTALLVFFVFFSFFHQTPPLFEDIKTKSFDTDSVYHLVQSETGEIVSVLSADALPKDASIKYLTLNDRVFTNDTLAFTSTQNGNDITISLEKPGIFLFEIHDLAKNYSIEYRSFTVQNLGPGIFVVNTLDSKKNRVFSFNTILDLTFKNKANLKIYPHSYLIFNPLKSALIKWWDLLRIGQVFQLGFLSSPIIEEDNITPDIFKITVGNDTELRSFIEDSLSYIIANSLQREAEKEIFLSQKWWVFPWENLISRFIEVFINEEKKIAYYKNGIISNLIEITKWNKNYESEIAYIANTLTKLRSISPEDAKEIDKIIQTYHSHIVSTNSKASSQAHISKLLLLTEENINDGFYYPSLLYLKNTFFWYDFLWDSWFYNSISSFTNQYGEDSINIWSKIDEGSLLFFLENILLWDYSSKEIEIKSLITLLQDYIEVSRPIHESSKQKASILYTNYTILEKFSRVLQEVYFTESRNSDWLLEVNPKTTIDSKLITASQSDISSLIQFYTKNKEILKDSKTSDILLQQNYEKISKIFEEYFSALLNYSEYVNTYDSWKKALLETSTINEQTSDTSLSKEKIISYLSEFNNIDLNNTRIDLRGYNYCIEPIEANISIEEEPYCYEVKGIASNWKLLNFFFYPFEKNKIDTISETINWNLRNINGSYKLDDIKKQLDEQYRLTTLPEEKYKYDFKNFFIITFSPEKTDSVNTWNNEDVSIVEEDKWIRVFKSTKLLWSDWDFASIQDFIRFKYNDIIVTKSNTSDLYDTSILWTPFSLSIPGQSNSSDIAWEFKSDYIFSDTDHSFNNSQIRVLRPGSSDTKRYLLSWNSIYIDTGFHVNSIETSLTEALQNIRLVEQVYNTLVSHNIWEYEISISYLLGSKNHVFTTTYKGKSLEITLRNSNTLDIVYSWEKVSDEQTTIDDLYNIILTLK